MLGPVALAALMVAVLGACNGDQAPAAEFEVVLVEPIEARRLPVQVRDSTGFVRMVEAGQAGLAQVPEFEGRGGVANPPGRQDQLVVVWVGGACDERVRLDVSRGGEGRLHLELATDVAPGGCDALGVQRSLTLSLGRPTHADQANLDFLPN
jgi:hypothetical protein